MSSLKRADLAPPLAESRGATTPAAPVLQACLVVSLRKHLNYVEKRYVLVTPVRIQYIATYFISI